MFPNKIFKIGKLQNCVLDNESEILAFASKRLERLKSQRFGTPEFYATLENIFKEFNDIYEYDKVTAVMPEPIGAFKTLEEKQLWKHKFLQILEFDLHLGSILYHYHEWLLDNEELPDIILSRTVVDYPTIYYKALYDYFSVIKYKPPHYDFEIKIKIKDENAKEAREKLIAMLQRGQLYGNEKPYFASFALPTLIERSLMDFMQRDLIKTLMKDLYNKYNNGTISLSESDLNLVNAFLQDFRIIDGNRIDITRHCCDLFKSAGLIPDNDTEEVVLGIFKNNRMSLGQFLKNKYVEKHIKKPYYDVLTILFSGGKVNLRNSIMHGANINFDPHAICFSAVEFQILWAIIDRNIFQ